jgi:hypothetical protein
VYRLIDEYAFKGGRPLRTPANRVSAETIALPAGSTTANERYIQVLTQPRGSVALEDVY